MATTTTLGFSILSRYSGHGVTQARRDLTALRAQIATLNGDLQRHTNLLGGIPNRWKLVGAAVLSVIPAMIPLSAAALQVAGAFTAMSVAVVASLGAYGAAMKGAISKTMEMAKAGKALSPVQKEFVSSVDGMKKAWADFISDTQNKTLATATNAVQGLTSGIKLLKPLVDAIHPSLLQISKDFEEWTKGDSARNYSNLLAAMAKVIMPNLAQAGKDVLNVLGDGFRAFAPLAKGLSESIADGARALKSWSDSGGFQRFLTYVRENAPAVQRFWDAFGAALANVFNILKQFSGGVLHVLTDALRALASINPESFKAFANALLLIKAPLLWLVLNCPALRDGIIALISAMNPQMIYAVAAAFVALKIAFLLMNTALLTTPLGWLILGLTALGVAIVVIATKTTWFQTAWTYTWNFIKTVALAVWSGIVTGWNAFIGAMQTAWNAVSGALVTAWNTVWNAISVVVRGLWAGLTAAWNAVCVAFMTIWNAVSSVFSASWSMIWTGIKVAAEFVWTALQVAWNLFLMGIQVLWSTISGALRVAWQVFWTALQTGAQFIWTAMQVAWQTLVNAFRTIYNIFSAALQGSWTLLWNTIKTVAQFVWTALQVAWQTLVNALRTIYNVFSSALQGSWQLLWNFIKTVAEAVWNWIKETWQAVLDWVRDKYNEFSQRFQDSWDLLWKVTKEGAEKWWDLIKKVIADAINWLLKPINLLIKGFNNIASALNMDISIPEIKVEFANGGMVGGVPHFAAGGVANFSNGGAVPGYAPGRDTVPAVLSRGEGVLVPEAVRGLGGANFVHGANHYFSKGRAPRRGSRWSPGGHGKGRGGGYGSKCGPQGFANGGMVGGVQHFAVGGMTAAALARAGVGLGMVTQGEYSNGSLSAGTHMGGGAVDLATTSPAVLAALHAAGFAAWIRGPAEGMSPHIHAVLMGHPDLSPAAAAQVASFLAGGSGLGVGGGGGGFSPIDFIKSMFGATVGEVLRKIAKFGGSLVDYMSGGGGGGDDDDGGGFLGSIVDTVTDIANPFNDDNPVADKAAEVAGGAASGIIGMFLAAIDRSAVEMAFDWIGFDDSPAGMMGDMMAEMGKQGLEGSIDWITNKAEEMAPDMSMMMGGDVSAWSSLAATALSMAGISLSQLPAFLALMQAESGGNPMAINNWDSNAAMGQASRGLMQVIPSTFAAYRDPSLSNNIFDPLANMVASARYIKAVYGGTVPGSPYANGTPGATRGLHLVGEQGPELMNFAGGETITPAKETAGIMAAAAPAMAAVPSLGSMPDEMTERFQLLMQLAQQMATTVQTSWTSVQNSGRNAQSAMAPLFTDMAAQLGTEIPTAMATMAATNTATWTAMQAGTTTAWTAMRDGTFAEAGDRMSVKMPQWGNEMNTAVTASWLAMSDATGQAWEGMKEATRGPVNWIIANSYNNGLARLWNEVAAVIFEGGGRTLPSVATLAAGGPVRGAGTSTSDSIPAMLSNGEHVWTAEEVRKAGGHRAVANMRSSIMGGKPVQGATGGPGFALGGWLGGAGSVGGGSLDISVPELKRGFIMQSIEPLFATIESVTRDALGGSDYRKGSAIADVLSPSKWMRDYITKDDELNRGGEGAEWARAQVGKPYVLGTFGSTFDCSTYMSGIATMIRDGVAAPWFTTHPFHGGAQSPLPGWERNLDAPFQIGITSSGIGHTGGTINGENFEATPPAVRSGPAARGANHSMYSYRYGFVPSGAGGAGGAGNAVDPADIAQGVTSFDRGGLLQPGYTLAFNGTGRPEPVGHNLEPKGSSGKVEINMPITINGNTDADKVVEGINSQVLPKLRQALNRGTGTNG